jgi:hypothetical protein
VLPINEAFPQGFLPLLILPSKPRVLRMRSNGEVEGPQRSAGQATRAHTVRRRPRRKTGHASRTPQTIVRRHRDHYVTEIASNPLPPSSGRQHSAP